MRESVRKAGQRVMVGFHGHEASADVKRMIQDYGAGSVILFARNVATPEQVAERWSPGPLAVLAAKAGCDLLPVCATHDAQVEALEGLVKAVESGEISWKAMDEACERMRRMKERFLLPWQDPDPKAARAAAGAGERVALARDIAEQAGMAI